MYGIVRRVFRLLWHACLHWPHSTERKGKKEKRTTLIIHIERTRYSEFNFFKWKYNSALDLGKENICYIRKKRVICFSVEECFWVTSVACASKIISWKSNEQWFSVFLLSVSSSCADIPTIGRNTCNDKSCFKDRKNDSDVKKNYLKNTKSWVSGCYGP